eukprot:SAG31_NODE_838_length_11617_cov_36.512936_13_plen_93_part_00
MPLNNIRSKIVVTTDSGHEYFVLAGMVVYMCGYAFVSGTVANFVVRLSPPAVSNHDPSALLIAGIIIGSGIIPVLPLCCYVCHPNNCGHLAV